MKNNCEQKGFTIVEGVVAILVVATLILGGWLAWEKNRTKVTDASANNGSSSNQKEQKTETTKPSETSTRFTSETGEFSFTYPEGWKVIEQKPTLGAQDDYIYMTPPSNVASNDVNNFLATLQINNEPNTLGGTYEEGVVQKLPNGINLWTEDRVHAEHHVDNNTTIPCPSLAIVSSDGAYFSHKLPNGKHLSLVAGYCGGERLTTTLSYEEQISSTAWRELINILGSVTLE